VAQGPRSILGAQEALDQSVRDPLLADCHVLVVDDEATIRNTIASVLTKRGAHVKVFESGQAAIDYMDGVEAGRIGLVLSDISMPDRNGYEVFASVRKHHANVPVILMTGFGYDPHHSIVRASQEGLQCVLFKPFQMDRLLEEVTKALASVEST
jgi:DNA-binding NtrC family response regulator